MSTDQVDLDISNYNYEELLFIFKIKNNNKIDENKNKINKNIDKIRTSFPEQIFNFYYKAKVIIFIIYDLYEHGFIKNLDDEMRIQYFIEKIVNITDFEVHQEKELFTFLTTNNNINNDTYSRVINNLNNISNNVQNNVKRNNIYSYIDDDNNISKETEGNINVLDNSLNKKYLNTGSGRINPNLNARNNTNIVQSTFPNQIAPGNLNSIKRIIQTQNLNLNSCFRSNYYNSNPCDFLYILPSEIKNVVSMRLASIEIPNAWYLFSQKQKNNIFKMDVIVDGVKEEFTICIPSGNYDCDSLQYFLNSHYFYESETTSFLKYIKFSINQYNFKTCFELVNLNLNDKNVSFSLRFVEDINQNIMNTVGWTFGFRIASYLSITEKIISEGLFDAGGDRYIYVSINDYQYNDNNFNTVCFDKSILNEDVIAKIPMINGKLSLIIDDKDNPLTKTRRYNGPVNISRFQIKILDKFGTIIDLNNMDFSFTLELEVLYESFNFKNVTS